MRAMILAAGRGMRMRPLSDRRPKPLMEAGGRPLIEHCIVRLVEAGVRELVVNHAWLGEQIVEALGDGSRFGAAVEYSPEPEGALDIAGGIIQALPLLGEAPFIVASADVWSDYPFRRLLAGPKGQAHLVLVDNPPYHSRGDFRLAGGWIGEGSGPRLTYSGIGVYRTELFAGRPPMRQALLPILEEAVGRAEVSGEHYLGRWFNVGTPADLAALERALRPPARRTG